MTHIYVLVMCAHGADDENITMIKNFFNESIFSRARGGKKETKLQKKKSSIRKMNRKFLKFLKDSQNQKFVPLITVQLNCSMICQYIYRENKMSSLKCNAR